MASAAYWLGNMAFSAIPTIGEFVEYFRVIEEERTKRQEIAAHRDVLIHCISAEKEVLLAYFDKRFAERRAALDEFFGLLHDAISIRDNHQLTTALMGILGIIQENPLEDFETFKKNFQDPNYIIEI